MSSEMSSRTGVPRRVMLGAAAMSAFFASCSSVRELNDGPVAQNAGANLAAPEATIKEPAAVEKTIALPVSGDFIGGAPAGAGMLTYDMSAERDWSDIDRWYRRRGGRRHEWTGAPRVHRIVGGTRNESGASLNLDALLLHGMVLENDPGCPPDVAVIAHHNVTRIRDGAVKIGDTVYDEPMMGIHAPEVAGDTWTWFLPTQGRTVKYVFEATSVQIIPDRDGEYEKLFDSRPDGKPQLVTYQCHPAGSLAQRRVVRHVLKKAEFTDEVVEFV